MNFFIDLKVKEEDKRIDLDEPYWDRSTFVGRLKYFFWATDPRTVIVPDSKLVEAQQLLDMYRMGNEPHGTTPDDIKYARKLHESAFHPDTGQQMNVVGRMSFQVPGNMVMMGCLLTFYHTTRQVVFMQWLNQSFNALVNYTNRNAHSAVTPGQLGIAYILATTSAVATSVGLMHYLQKVKSTLLPRFVPFVAVAAACCVNIPLMRQSELIEGIAVYDENGNKVTHSKLAAAKGITQVVISRISMAAPGMLITPIIMERLEKYPRMKRIQFLNAPIQVMIVGCFLTFMVPVSCAFFRQKCSMKVSTLRRWEPDSYAQLLHNVKDERPVKVYFNKGL